MNFHPFSWIRSFWSNEVLEYLQLPSTFAEIVPKFYFDVLDKIIGSFDFFLGILSIAALRLEICLTRGIVACDWLIAVESELS